jgi:hypothetical protein
MTQQRIRASSNRPASWSFSDVNAGQKVCLSAIGAPQPGYDRRAALARVLALWPHELEDESPAARRMILAKLRRALRAERRRGVSGHWTYDLARHVELLRVYRAELAAVAGSRGEEASSRKLNLEL